MKKKSKPKEYIKIKAHLLDCVDFLNFKYKLNLETPNALFIIYKLADWVHRIGKHGVMNCQLKLIDSICETEGVAKFFSDEGWVKTTKNGFYFTPKFPCCPAYARKGFSEKFRRNFLQDKECAICSSIENLEIDHIIPVCDGGSHDQNNLQVLCRSCNRKKSSKSGEFYGR